MKKKNNDVILFLVVCTFFLAILLGAYFFNKESITNNVLWLLTVLLMGGMDVICIISLLFPQPDIYKEMCFYDMSSNEQIEFLKEMKNKQENTNFSKINNVIDKTQIIQNLVKSVIAIIIGIVLIVYIFVKPPIQNIVETTLIFIGFGLVLIMIGYREIKRLHKIIKSKE